MMQMKMYMDLMGKMMPGNHQNCCGHGASECCAHAHSDMVNYYQQSRDENEDLIDYLGLTYDDDDDDGGFTINFKENGNEGYNDALQYFENKGYLPSHQELEAKEREIRKKHDEDAMKIDFPRDQKQSHWSNNAHEYAFDNYYNDDQQ